MENQTFFQKNKNWIITVGILIILALSFMSSYNSFISSNEAVTAQWAQVDNQLQRRFDLIPNIERTVKGITKQEKDIFGIIADARTRYAGAQTTDAKAVAAGQVESALGRLLVISENYPQLQSSQSFRDLTVELEGTENRISVERMKYNDLVRVFNASVKRFPSSLVARIAGMSERSYFEVTDTAKEVPKVDFTK